jgi:hypothetical protein
VSSGERKRRRLNLGRVKPAGVAGGVLWGVLVVVLPRRRGWRFVLAEGFWKGPPEWVRAPYAKAWVVVWRAFPSSSELVEFAVNLPGPPGKPKYFLVTDSGRVP